MDILRFEAKTMQRAGMRGQDMAPIFPAKFGYDLKRSRDQQERDVLDAMKQCSPIHFISADDPPVLACYHALTPITSREHPPVPDTINDPHSYWHGTLLADALENAGVTVQRHIGPNVDRDEANAVRAAAFIIDHLCRKEEQKQAVLDYYDEGIAMFEELRYEPQGPHKRVQE